MNTPTNHTPTQARTVLLFTDGGELFTVRMLPEGKDAETVKRDAKERCAGEIDVIDVDAETLLKAVRSHAALVAALESAITILEFDYHNWLNSDISKESPDVTKKKKARLEQAKAALRLAQS